MIRITILSLLAVAMAACQSTRSTPVVEATTKVRPAPAGSIPVVGQEAPAFSLASSEGTTTSLDEMRGKWVVLYFYPKNFSGGCTAEAQNFQRDQERYASLNAVVVGVSVDSVASHKEFCAQEGLQFRLLSDSEGMVSATYGSLNRREGSFTSARNTFVIDPDGRVAAVFTKVNPTSHSSEVLATLETLRAH